MEVKSTESIALVLAAHGDRGGPARNDALEQELDQFQNRIRELERSLDRVAANDARFRNLAGLASIDPEVLQAGVGGPGLGFPESSPLWSTDSVTTRPLYWPQ